MIEFSGLILVMNGMLFVSAGKPSESDLVECLQISLGIQMSKILLETNLKC